VLQLPGGELEIARGDWLLAEDGAHSTVRQQLQAAFPGRALEGEWYLADVPLKTRLAPDRGHVFFFEGGRFLFLIRVVDEALPEHPGGALWRVISNRSEPLAQLAQAEQAAAPLWQSAFRVSHRMVANLIEGNVYFAGDAAHLHSPIGARGMNLGIEDAWVLSELARNRLLPSYHALRYRIDRQVVRRVELLSRMVAAQSPFARLMREWVLPAAVQTPGVRGRLLAAVTGLDHPLPLFSGSAVQPEKEA
jgi:2-polyprenyl-6-methoxyphenol hydroxylase-like FAD-dependent oxidoreductase